VELRDTGRTPLSLIYDAKLSQIGGQLTLIEKGLRVPLIIDDQVVQVPAVHASGSFAGVPAAELATFIFSTTRTTQ
jgi:hypothetical protein